jgi:transposase-like protein
MAATKPRSNHQPRIDWWRAQFQRQQSTNLNVADFCRQLGVSVTTFYYWRKRVEEAPPGARADVPGVAPSRHSTATANFLPLSIIEPAGGTELEIELTNSCVLRLKGTIDPSLLQAAITAAGQLDGSREGAN